jgi:hypothetical protein
VTTIATVFSVMAIVTVKVSGLQKIAVTINGGLAISAASAKQGHDAIRRQCGSAERNRRTPVRENAGDSKDDGDKRNRLGHNGPLTEKLSGRPGAPIKRRRRTLSPRAGGAQPQAVHGPLQRLLEDASKEVTARPSGLH